ncbi:MAG: alkaline phosphatase D family protein [Gammaproteobacteria bacterium]|nr:alkaline phosphatase D family protein [Gammaproteobacteria bacterium]MDH3408301.1 alkaline phosphatase D family protein [Gammaproteobacteria bacterium]
MLRRRFIHLFGSGILFAALGVNSRRGTTASRDTFQHGVASGDPLADAVIIWTRISGAQGEIIRVDWQVASDSGMQTVLRSGQAKTDADRDYTVKIDVDDLPPGAQLYYRFIVDGVASRIGTTRTLPRGDVPAARFAVVSCSNYPTGYFHAYREIADRRDLDAVIHLGDYLYEYGLGEYATEYAEQLDRIPNPRHELISLEDYRLRHAQYKTDPDLQAMHAAHPVIAVWDDHEIANDCWRKGAQNHNDDEGRWGKRRDAAIKAYFEWMPIRGESRGKHTKIFREFRFGKLLSLTMLDTRLYGRDRQPQMNENMQSNDVHRMLSDPGRRLLGKKQEQWLRDTLSRASETTWQVVAQQVLVSPVRAPDLEPLIDPEGPTMLSREFLDHSIAMSKSHPPLLLDTWDGYAAARQDLLTDLKELAANPVVLSGDLHTSIAGNLHLPGQTEPVAVEFMTASVTSPGFAEYLPERRPGGLSDATRKLNPNLKYMETDRRGWLCMTITPAECSGEWHLLDGVRSRQNSSTIDRRLSVAAGRIAEGLYDS